MVAPARRSGTRRNVFQEIANDLRSGIQADVYEGGRLPSENELMELYGAARATVRRAIAVLVEEGLAITQPGKGAFVREYSKIVRNEPERTRHSRWSRGKAIQGDELAGHTSRVEVSITYETASSEVRALLGLSAGADVMVRRRRYIVDGKPRQLATSYVPKCLAITADATHRETGPGGIWALFEAVGRGPRHFVDDLATRMPTPAESRELALSPSTPVCIIGRLALDHERTPVEYNEMVFDGSSYVFRYTYDA